MLVSLSGRGCQTLVFSGNPLPPDREYTGPQTLATLSISRNGNFRLLIIDERGEVRACGESLAKLLGRDSDELVGQPVWTLLPGWSPFNGTSAQAGLRLAGSHSSLPVLAHGEPLHLSGETLFTVDVFLFSAFAQAAPAEAVMVTDRRGEIRHVNPGFTALTGYSSVDVAGLTPALLKSGAHDRATYAKLWDTILDGRVYRGALMNRRKDGNLYHEDKVIRPVLDAKGRPLLFLSSGRDVTARTGELEALLGGCAAAATS